MADRAAPEITAFVDDEMATIHVPERIGLAETAAFPKGIMLNIERLA